MVVDGKMEAACYIRRETKEWLGIWLLRSTDKLKIISVDGKGCAGRTNVSFGGKTFVGMGLKVNDEIKEVNSTKEPHGMLEELINADERLLVIHRPPPPPPETPPPRAKLHPIPEEAEVDGECSGLGGSVPRDVCVQRLFMHAEGASSGQKDLRGLDVSFQKLIMHPEGARSARGKEQGKGRERIVRETGGERIALGSKSLSEGIRSKLLWHQAGM